MFTAKSQGGVLPTGPVSATRILQRERGNYDSSGSHAAAGRHYRRYQTVRTYPFIFGVGMTKLQWLIYAGFIILGIVFTAIIGGILIYAGIMGK